MKDILDILDSPDLELEPTYAIKMSPTVLPLSVYNDSCDSIEMLLFRVMTHYTSNITHGAGETMFGVMNRECDRSKFRLLKYMVTSLRSNNVIAKISMRPVGTVDQSLGTYYFISTWNPHDKMWYESYISYGDKQIITRARKNKVTQLPVNAVNAIRFIALSLRLEKHIEFPEEVLLANDLIHYLKEIMSNYTDSSVKSISDSKETSIVRMKNNIVKLRDDVLHALVDSGLIRKNVKG